MRAATYLVLAVTLFLAAGAATWATAGARLVAARMQDASPPGTAIDGPNDWWIQPTVAPEHRMYLDRLVLNPGEGHDQDGSLAGSIIFVETGSVTFTVANGVVFLGGDAGESAATQPSSAAVPRWPGPLPVGVAVPLGPGDTVFHDGEAEYGFANVGEGASILWRSELDEPRPADSCAGGRC